MAGDETIRRLDANFSATLDDLDQWLASRGIKQRNRFRIYKDNIAKLGQLAQQKSPEQIHTEVAQAGRLAEMLSSFVEAIEIVENWPTLRDSQIDIPNELLETALSGPADASQEDEKSNRGRNAMFELSMGAMIARAGFRPTFCPTNPDIAFELENRCIKVECKRLISEEKLFLRIKEAIGQLSKTVRAGSTDVGLVAVSVARLFNPGDRVAVAANDESPYTILSRTLDLTLKNIEHELAALAKPSVSAVLFYISSPFYVPYIGYTWQASGTVFPMNLTEKAFLRKLAQTFRV